MANPQSSFSPPPYQSPHPTPPLQQTGPYPPPAKRPKLSPNAQSPLPSPSFSQTSPQFPLASPQLPNVSPQLANGSLPHSVAGTPFPMAPTNGASPRPLTEPHTPIGGTMGPPIGPPQRPQEEKAADLNDISDVMYGTGVVLRDEEAALSAGQRAPMAYSYFDQRPMMSLVPNVPGDKATFFGAGPLNQPVSTQDAMEEQQERDRKLALRKQNERKQYHMHHAFLNTQSIYNKMLQRTRALQVKEPTYGQRAESVIVQSPTLIRGPNPDNDLAARVQSRIIVPTNGPATDIIALLSLAAKERIGGLVEDTAALARGRRATAQGIVRADLAEIAQGKGKAEETSYKPPTPNPLKRSFSEMTSDPAIQLEDPPSELKTVAFTNLTTKFLNKYARSERSIEEKRAARRNARNANGLLSAEASRAASIAATPLGTPGEKSSTPTLADAGADVSTAAATPASSTAPLPKKGITKKEQKKQADLRASEQQQAAATTSSMNLALGTKSNVFGGKKISWMTSKQPAADTSFVPPRASVAAKASGTGGAGGAAAGGGAGFGGRVWGEFREDRVGGRGVQLRDVIGVLELDKRERQALGKAYNRLNRAGGAASSRS